MASCERYIVAALELGFSRAVFLPGLKLCCRPEIRMYCNPEQCQNYNHMGLSPRLRIYRGMSGEGIGI